MRSLASSILTTGCLLGCSGESTQIGTAERFRVHAPSQVTWTAQFVKGELPGTAPVSGPDAGTGNEPVVTLSAPRSAIQGQGDLPISGFATSNAVSVGVAMQGVSTGYWVVPVGAPDQDPKNGLEWHALFDVDRTIPSQSYNLQAVAFDENGNAGPQAQPKNICVASSVPDNFRSCTRAFTPEAVISLEWDTNVDLDLQVRTPTGRIVEPKSPTSLAPSDVGAIPAGSATIDRDSNAGCVNDAIRHENLVWPTGTDPAGRYAIYANLFDSCKQSSVRFTVTAYRASHSGEDGGNSHLVQGFEKSGELLDFQANGGSGRGLFVGEIVFH
jgi:hypothetical protein